MWLLLVAIASIIIWNAVSQKMLKSSKKKNKGKILTLMSAGTLSTLILTASLFQSITLLFLSLHPRLKVDYCRVFVQM